MNTPVIRSSLVIVFGWAATALLPAQTPAPATTGSNTTVLTGTNTYSGSTTVSSGTMTVTPPPQRGPMGPRLDVPPASPQCTLIQTIGNTKVTLVYYRPDMKGRKIFGGLLPYGEVWRTGANNETTIEFSTDVKLNGNAVPKGKYGLFTIPGPDKWTVIIDKNSKMWGAFTYDPSEDLLRFDVKPVTLPTPVETFGIEIKDIHDDSAVMNLLWETTRVPITIQTDAVDKVLAEIDAAMSASTKPPPSFYVRAAGFYNDHYEDHKLDLNKALDWINEGIAGYAPGTPGYNTRYTAILMKARIQAKLGDMAGARANAEKALDMATHDMGKDGKQSMEGIEYTRVAKFYLDSLAK